MLKTDYKDDVFEGNRKYDQVINGDGTVSLVDVTTYTQEGDQFGGNDMNATNREVNRLGNDVIVTLPASGWSNTLPYSQKIAVSGIKATDKVGIYPYTPKELSAADIKVRKKMSGMITDGESEDGYMNFYCGEKKPTADFAVRLMGVSVDG